MTTKCGQPSELELPSSSQHNDLGRVRRVKARPLRGRFASFDTAATTRGMAAIEEDGRGAGHGVGGGEVDVRRAISGPLTPVTRGISRSLKDNAPRRSGPTGAPDCTDSQADRSR